MQMQVEDLARHTPQQVDRNCVIRAAATAIRNPQEAITLSGIALGGPVCVADSQVRAE